MVPATARDDDDEIESNGTGRKESRVTALARDLVDTVGVEGAIRYCSSVGWRGVLDEVEMLRSQQARTK